MSSTDVQKTIILDGISITAVTTKKGSVTLNISLTRGGLSVIETEATLVKGQTLNMAGFDIHTIMGITKT